jgi:hypothetical protein
MICKPKDKGGLGIMDFRKQNEGLLMKHLHNFITRKIFPGCSWSGNIMKMKSHILLNCVVHIGERIL